MARAKRGPKVRHKAMPAGPAPPAGLSVAEQAEFARLVVAARSAGTLDRVDVQLLVAAARTQALLDRAYGELPEGDLTLEAANGTAMPHPMLGVINAQTLRLRGLLKDLGLTPASSKLGARRDADAPDRWKGLLNVVG